MSGVATGHWPIEARILSLAVQGDTRSARELAAAALERGSSRHSGRARVMAYDSLASFVAADYETAAVTAEIALISFDRGGNGETEDGGEDRRASAVTAAARLVAAAGVTWAGDGEAIEDTGAAEDALLEGHDWAAEPLPRSLDGLPLPSMPLLPVRVLVFLGRVAEADRLAALVGEQAAADGDELWQALCDSVRAFCAGGMGDVAEVRRLAAAS